MVEVYQPSGKLGISSFFLVGLGTVTMVVAGWIYQLLVNWNPPMILNVLLLVSLAFAGIFVTLTVIQYGKVRNPIVGIFFWSLGLYGCHCCLACVDLPSRGRRKQGTNFQRIHRSARKGRLAP